jgi:SAM-dependent methyltransferase
MSDNAEQAEFWNGRMGTAWVNVADYIDRMMAPLSDVALDAVNAKPDDRIIDVGCGCGTTSFSLGASGAAVWGVDISKKMIDRANQKHNPASNVDFSVSDAASQQYTPDHTVVFSRFGVMFFADPVKAFANLRSALVPSGRLVFLCWQLPAANPWLSIAGDVLQPFQPADAPAPNPEAPGPFRLAVPDYTREILGSAGFTNIAMQPVVKDLYMGANIDEVMRFQSNIGPLSGLLETLDKSRHPEATAAVRDAFAAKADSNGINLEASTWLVTATNG